MAFHRYLQMEFEGLQDPATETIQIECQPHEGGGINAIPSPSKISNPAAHIGKNKVIAFPHVEDSFDTLTSKQMEINNARDSTSTGLVESNYEKLSFMYLLRPLAGILLALLFIIGGLVLLPQHDIFKEPYYWWECFILQCDFIWLNSSAACFVTTANYLLNLEGVFTVKHYFITWAISAAFYSFSWCVTYVIWTPIFGFRYPIPFNGIVNALLGLSSQVLALWISIRKTLGTPDIKIRFRFVMLTFVFIINISVGYWVLWWIFINVPIDYQWTLVIALPLVREGLGKIMALLGKFKLYADLKIIFDI